MYYENMDKKRNIIDNLLAKSCAHWDDKFSNNWQVEKHYWVILDEGIPISEKESFCECGSGHKISSKMYFLHNTKTQERAYVSTQCKSYILDIISNHSRITNNTKPPQPPVKNIPTTLPELDDVEHYDGLQPGDCLINHIVIPKPISPPPIPVIKLPPVQQIIKLPSTPPTSISKKISKSTSCRGCCYAVYENELVDGVYCNRCYQQNILIKPKTAK
eukprot:Lithocolla_globosa_v1_NODE_1995_length_2217_cov_64.659574.p1 type:complete len:217 gc:universal NODE_1995_length_2217_cov_64.659574:1652-1002(-)